MQAKDVDEAALLGEIDRQGIARPTYVGAVLWDIEAAMPSVPGKVLRAKLKSMIRRGVIDGCPCGECRGDYRRAHDQ